MTDDDYEGDTETGAHFAGSLQFALKVELTRRGVGPILGRRILAVERTDPLVVGSGVDDAVAGATIETLSRRGKLLVVHTDQVDVGVHLGMTGRLLLDDVDPLGRLATAAAASTPGGIAGSCVSTTVTGCASRPPAAGAGVAGSGAGATRPLMR